MSELVHGEVRKLWTLRLTWWLTAAGLAVAALVGVAGATAPGAAVVTLREAVLGPVQLLWFVVVVVAVVATAGEFSHRTIRTTLLVAPRRVPLLLAKAAVAAAYGAALVLVGSTVTAVACVAARVATGDPLPAWSAGALGTAVAAAVTGAGWAVVGVGIGVLTRSTAVALVAVLLWRFVGEGVLPVVTRSPGIGRWTPSGAADGLLGTGGDRLAVLPAAALLVAYAVAVVGAAAALFLRRDPA